MPQRLPWFLMLFATAMPSTSQGQEALHVRVDRLMDAAALSPTATGCSDAEFLRRASLDLIGIIPTSAEARAFLDDPAPNKREVLVDRLLAHPRQPVHLASAFHLMWMERRADKHVPVADWLKFLAESFRQNKPYDQLVRELLTADSANPAARPAAKFLLDRDADPHLLTRDIGRMFFGVDLQCAQCHDHPLIDDYLQADYYGLHAFVNRTGLFVNQKDNNKGYLAEAAAGGVEFKSVFTGYAGKTRPRLIGGPELDEPRFHLGEEYAQAPTPNNPAVPKFSRRALLATAIGDGSNAQFRRNIVNRLWAQMMGRGLVHPVDLHHSDNPPSHPDVLDLLADEIKSVNFQIKPLLRELALTKAYQRAIDVPAEAAAPANLDAQLAVWKTEQEQFAAATQAAKTELEKLSAQAEEAQKTLAPLEETLTKADANIVAVKKPYDEAQTALAKAQEAQTAKQAAVTAVNEALAKGMEASKLFPNDAEVAQAVAVFQARAQKVTGEMEATAKAVADQMPVVQTALAKLNEAHAAGDAAHVQLAEARKPIDAVKALVAAAQTQQRGQNAQAQGRKLKAALLQRLADHAAKRATWVSAETAVGAAQAEATAASQALAMAMQATNEAKQLVDAKNQALFQAVEQRNAAAAALVEAQSQLTTAWTTQFAVRDLKPLTPEQLGWSVQQAAGIVDAHRAAADAEIEKTVPKAGVASDPVQAANRAAQVEQLTFDKLVGNVNVFVTFYGAAPGQPQDDFFATPDQALFLANGGNVRSWVAPGSALFERLNTLSDPKLFAEEMYLSVLTRRPTDGETAAVAEYLAARPNERPAVIQELLWALLASAEFRFQH